MWPRTLSARSSRSPLSSAQVIFYGTEQGFGETFGEDDRRQALWSSKYRTDTVLYLTIAKLNALRKREGIGTSAMTLHHADGTKVVFSRAGGLSGLGVWVFANNEPASGVEEPRKYCIATLPPTPPAGMRWVDELSGESVRIADGCVEVGDGRPKVLVMQAGED